MHVRDLVAALESIAPPRYAESWDNTGLLVGAADWPARRVMLAIDLTAAVMDEAAAAEADMIVAYHPPIFEPLRAVTDGGEKSRIVLELAAQRIAVYSPHTALDAAPGGVNDWLAGIVGPGEVTALTPAAVLPDTEAMKIVTFCPRGATDAIRGAMAAAGAGRIGAYAQCSFELPGTGTFLGGAGTAPVVGRRGRLERVDEVRLELVCSEASLARALAALRLTHPYEEPPIEVHPLLPRPDPAIGAGRRVRRDRPASLKRLVEASKRGLGVRGLQVASGRGGRRSYTVVGVCAGAGGAMLDVALANECELFLTGEMWHHDVLAAQAAGCTVVLAGHTNTERGYLPLLRKTLRGALPALDVTISRRDRDPLKAM